MAGPAPVLANLQSPYESKSAAEIIQHFARVVTLANRFHRLKCGDSRYIITLAEMLGRNEFRWFSAAFREFSRRRFGNVPASALFLASPGKMVFLRRGPEEFDGRAFFARVAEYPGDRVRRGTSGCHFFRNPRILPDRKRLPGSPDHGG